MSAVTEAPKNAPDASGIGSRLRGAAFPVRYFLRYGYVGIATAVLLACETAAMLQRGMQWRGDIVWTIDWVPVSFIIVGPVVAGLAALDTAGSATGAGHMFRNPVHRTPAAAVVASYVVVLSLAHFVFVAAALVVSAPPVFDPGAPVAVLVQILMLVFFVCVGACVGRFTGPVMAGFIGAISALVLVYITSSPGKHLMLLEFGGATVPRVGYAYDAQYLGWQCLALLLASAALLVLRPLEGRRRNQITVLDGSVAVVLVACVLLILSTVRGDRLKSIDVAPTDCGAAATIPTCFYPQHDRVAKAFTEQFWILATAAQDNGYADILPKAVVEASRTRLPQEQDPDVAAFYVTAEHLQGDTPSLWEIASGIVQPLQCKQLQGEKPPSERYDQDLGTLIATWVSLADPEEAADLGYPTDMTPAAAATLIRQFRECTYPHF